MVEISELWLYLIISFCHYKINLVVYIISIASSPEVKFSGIILISCPPKFLKNNSHRFTPTITTSWPIYLYGAKNGSEFSHVCAIGIWIQTITALAMRHRRQLKDYHRHSQQREGLSKDLHRALKFRMYSCKWLKKKQKCWCWYFLSLSLCGIMTLYLIFSVRLKNILLYTCIG